MNLNCFFILIIYDLVAKNITQLKWSEKIEFLVEIAGTRGWWLYMHNSYDVPSSNNWNHVKLIGKTKYSLSWNLGAFRLLESPYRTNCRNYKTSTEYLSRKDCIRNCKMNASLTNCKVIYNGIDIQRGEPSLPFAVPEVKECISKIDLDTICEILNSTSRLY